MQFSLFCLLKEWPKNGRCWCHCFPNELNAEIFFLSSLAPRAIDKHMVRHIQQLIEISNIPIVIYSSRSPALVSTLCEISRCTVQCSPVLLYTVHCYTVQCSTVLRSTVLRSTVQCSTVIRSTVLRSTVLRSTVQCSTVLRSTVLRSTVQCSTVLRSTVLRSTVQCSTVLRSTVLRSTVNCTALVSGSRIRYNEIVGQTSGHSFIHSLCNFILMCLLFSLHQTLAQTPPISISITACQVVAYYLDIK